MRKKLIEMGKGGIVFCLAVLALLLTVPFLLGMRPRIVVSGSMEPTVPVGSLAYLSPYREAETITEGDIIAYETGNAMTVLHRVVRIDVGERNFVTKGDANQTEDPGKISFEQYRGKLVFVIPLAGYLAAALQQHRVAAAGLLAAAAAAGVLRHLTGKRKQVITGENF